MNKEDMGMLKRVGAIFAVILIGTTLCGCTSQRWTISNTKYSYKGTEFPDTSYDVQMTILLDTKRGNSWALIPTKDQTKPGYSWVLLPH